MAPIVPNPKAIKSFASEAAFEAWLAAHHDTATELWLKLHKKGSGLASVTYAQALDVALCWGWIDGLKKSFDDRSFLQRFTPRKPRSVWSQVNRDHVARLTAAGRMTPHGQAHVEAARADGRWEAAYAPIRAASAEALPADLRAAIDADPRAKATLATLDRQNLFALAFRVANMKTAAGRTKKIAALVAMLARGDTISPMSASRTKANAAAPATPAKKPAKQPPAKQPAKQPPAKQPPAKQPRAAEPSARRARPSTERTARSPR